MKRERNNLYQKDVLAAMEQFRKLRVAVIGEVIIDEYVYCDALGKSGKEPVLVSRFIALESHGGGAIAIANHVSEFCKSVELVSALGEIDPREEFVRSTLRPGVRLSALAKKASPTIVKRRYVDSYSLAKMMGVYHLNAEPLGAEDEARFSTLVQKALTRADLVIVADYGHGLMTEKVIRQVSDNARFLAVNTQMNAANQGYHTLSKYPRADYVCLHEGELRLDARDLGADIRAVLERTAIRIKAKSFTVTRGKAGTLLYKQGAGFFESPSRAEQVVERVGAGDAVLALTALAAACDIDPELMGLLGNLAGAQQVAVVGNSASVSKEKMLERLREIVPPWSKVGSAAV